MLSKKTVTINGIVMELPLTDSHDLKTAPDYSRYLINRNGHQVINKKTGRSLKIQYDDPNSSRYASISIVRDSTGKSRTIEIHQLVGSAFLPNPDPENNKKIGRKRSDHHDNSVENLEWSNMSDITTAANKRREDEPLVGASAKPVYRYLIEEFTLFNSMKVAAEAMKVSRQAIEQACKKGTKCAGYYWKPVKGPLDPEIIKDWKRLKPYLKYQISDKGIVHHDKLGIITRTIPKKGKPYPYVRLRNDETKGRDRQYVHRLVALLYVPNDDPENKTEANHLNRDTYDPRASNLRWDTPSDNRTHKDKSTCKKIDKYTMDGEYVSSYNSLKEAAAATGIAYQNISAVLNGRKKSAGKFLWK